MLYKKAGKEENRLKTKLKNLEITKVDFVPAGANQEADILIYKSKDGKSEESGEKGAGMVKEKGVFKKLVEEIGKIFEMKQEEIEETLDEVEKGKEDQKKEDKKQKEAPKKKEEFKEKEKEEDTPTDLEDKKKKGMEKGMDKSKMTPVDKMAYEDLEKKYLPKEDTEQSKQTGSEVYKGLHPEIQKELEALRKWRGEAEEKELGEIAKKYEIIGKKTDDLIPVLKNLKNTSTEAYESMIAVMDASVEAVEKSGLFAEVGRNGHVGYSSVAKSGVVGKIETLAREIQKADPSFSQVDAIAKAWEDHPELAMEYESEIQ